MASRDTSFLNFTALHGAVKIAVCLSICDTLIWEGILTRKHLLPPRERYFLKGTIPGSESQLQLMECRSSCLFLSNLFYSRFYTLAIRTEPVNAAMHGPHSLVRIDS